VSSDVSTTSTESVQAAPSPNQLAGRFANAFRPKRWIYWTDMLGSAAIGWTCFVLSVQAPFGTLMHLLASVGAIFCLLRAILFIHELVHLKPGQIPGFEVVWNLLVGFPLLVPSLMYVGSHKDHHRRTAFGTNDDPEYAPIAHWSRPRIASFVATVAFVPALLFVRWGLLGPLSRLIPALRPITVGKCSTLVINSDYSRPMPKGSQLKRWNLEEAGAAVYVWVVVAGVAIGWLPVAFLAQFWLVGGGVLIVNQLRTLAAHGYENAGVPVDTQGQLLDSINLRGWAPVTALVAPVGLSYHALHHYLPSLPYHSLGQVHRQLLEELPEDSPYRTTLRGGLLDTLQRIWHKAAPV
jgi:fatty acid desaturase